MRSRRDFGEAVEMVGAEKQRRLRRAAEAWLARHPDLCDLDVSFDVVGIEGRRLERLRDAF
jgi:Holliday junction resolvase-like predicted endonuclease